MAAVALKIMFPTLLDSPRLAWIQQCGGT